LLAVIELEAFSFAFGTSAQNCSISISVVPRRAGTTDAYFLFYLFNGFTIPSSPIAPLTPPPASPPVSPPIVATAFPPVVALVFPPNPRLSLWKAPITRCRSRSQNGSLSAILSPIYGTILVGSEVMIFTPYVVILTDLVIDANDQLIFNLTGLTDRRWANSQLQARSSATG